MRKLKKQIENPLPTLIMTVFLIKQIWIGKSFTCHHVKPSHVSMQILNNVLNVKNIVLRFAKFKSSLLLLLFCCKLTVETTIPLFSRCTAAQDIWTETQIFFSNYVIIPNILPQGAILSFTGGLNDDYNIIINHNYFLQI